MDREYGGWGSFRYLELNGRIKKTIQFPRRERLLVRTALKHINIIYHELMPFFNPLHTGFREKENGSVQWIDFTCYTKETGMFVLQFNPRYGQSGVKPHERRAYQNKRDYVEKIKKIPFLLLSRNETSQIYEARIRRLIQKERK